MRFISGLALVLIVVGALNWGLWGLFQFDLVAWIFGGNTMPWSRLFYIVIGLSGVWGLKFVGKMLGLCSCCCGCKCGGKCSDKSGKGGSCCK